ncbi:hypothetical protein EON76_04460 [bacterium]|nr:MAG: hypothetical protein EON76_04460 [bacterium]
MTDNDPIPQRNINTYATCGVEDLSYADATKHMRFLRDKCGGLSDEYRLLDEAARYIVQFTHNRATNDSYVDVAPCLNGALVGHDIALHLLPAMEHPLYLQRLEKLPEQFRDQEIDGLLHVDDTPVTEFVTTTGEYIFGIGEQAISDELEGVELTLPILNGLNYDPLQRHSFLVGAGYPLFIADSILTNAAINQQKVNETARSESDQKTFKAFMNILNTSYSDDRSD